MRKNWKVIETLGKGGNGVVHKVQDESGNLFAMKVLRHNTNTKAYSRFKSEVEVLLSLKNQNGVIKIIDSYLPEKISVDSKPYYVMPLGVRFKDYIQSVTQDKFYSLFFELADTLEALHKLDITHRDIKPDNILVVNDKPVFSDFGLANFPKKEKVSTLKEKIGPKWTIAPEMERISSTAEFKKADIYSFAKTLWILITKQGWGFEGQYIPYSSISIDNYVDVMINKRHWSGKWYYFSIVLLNQLLVQSTDNNPANRPDAQTFNERLKYWYISNNDYFERNPYEWQDAIKRIFPISIPNSCKWTSFNEILYVLKIICCGYDNLNHSFYPDHGGDDFEAVDVANESNCLIINNDTILKPSALIFEFMEDYNWSYFRLELSSLAPLFFTNESNRSYEELYIDSGGNYSNKKNHGSIKLVTRYLGGNIIIVKKTSKINDLEAPLDAYSGFHNKLTNDEYKNLLLMVKTVF